MLKGKAKTDYQREYMRRRRGSNNSPRGSNKKGLTRMGYEPKPTPQEYDADGNPMQEY